MTTSLAGLFFGVLLGARHSLEPDHLAAVTTMVSEQRGARAGAIVGAVWGLGHTLALLLVGGVLGALRLEMPARLAVAFELAVAVMLIVLGARSMWRAAREGRGGPVLAHAHGRSTHVHAGPPAHAHVGRFTLARRPLIVGLVHGLAGTGALTTLVIANLPTASERVAYIGLFGVGSLLGMCALSGLLGWPLSRLGRRPRMARAMSALAGLGSATLGVAWAWPLLP
jgi:ABC-type nickel/cobalt efflux system permease component RcnA